MTLIHQNCDFKIFKIPLIMKIELLHDLTNGNILSLDWLKSTTPNQEQCSILTGYV